MINTTYDYPDGSITFETTGTGRPPNDESGMSLNVHRTFYKLDGEDEWEMLKLGGYYTEKDLREEVLEKAETLEQVKDVLRSIIYKKSFGILSYIYNNIDEMNDERKKKSLRQNIKELIDEYNYLTKER